MRTESWQKERPKRIERVKNIVNKQIVIEKIAALRRQHDGIQSALNYSTF